MPRPSFAWAGTLTLNRQWPTFEFKIPTLAKTGLGWGTQTKQIILSVKAGHLQAAHVRDLRGVIERERAEIGVLISMEPLTKPMLKEAAEAGFYQPPGLTNKYPRLQILSIAELLLGKQVEYPRMLDVTYKKAPRARGAAAEQIELGTGEDEGPF